MAWLFGKGPDYYTAKLISSHAEYAAAGDGDLDIKRRISENLNKYSSKLRDTMYGDGAKDPQPAQCERLARAWLDRGMIAQLPTLMENLDFESRKNVSMVFCALVRGDYCSFASSGLAAVPELVRDFVDRYPDREAALAVGPMIRESVSVGPVHACLLRGDKSGAAATAARVRRRILAAAVDHEVSNAAAAAAAASDEAAGTPAPTASSASASASAAASASSAAAPSADAEEAADRAAEAVSAAVSSGMSIQLVELLAVWTGLPNFEVSADAIATLTAILTAPEHKAAVGAFLLEQAEVFFPLYMSMLHPFAGPPKYTLQLQALKLLGELLLDREHFDVMVGFIQRTRHLRAVMTLLRSKQSAIQFEAFHVFKIFVANPRKPDPIVEVLVANKDKLVSFLRGLQNDREDDQFHDEKALLIETLESSLSLPDDYVSRLLVPRASASAALAEATAASEAVATAAAAASAMVSAAEGEEAPVEDG